MDKPSSSRPPLPVTNYDQDEDAILSKSEFLTRDEVLKRRVRRLRRLSKFYRDYYWLLMEDVRIKHREYVWKYGKSPCIEENGDVVVVKRENGDIGDEVLDNNVDNGDKLGLGSDVNFKRCAFSACSAKAMALTNYCVAHIVIDTKQVLYKRCKSPQTVLKSYRAPVNGQFSPPLMCSSTVLKSDSPYLCNKHAEDTRKHISASLKKSGAPATVSARLASKFQFHLVIKEYVNHIQSKRRSIANGNDRV
ncbi:unnamed protein product [Amaranthus hypochondriacus]